MTTEERALAERLRYLEGAVHRTRLVAGCALIGLAATWLMAAGRGGQAQGADTVRTKALIVEDAQGRARIVLGAPMPDGRQQVGMKILNSDGAEQFGLGLKPDGSVSMGFDTRPGVGNPANRERLNMGVTASGRGWIRYLDNQTRARMWLMLDSTDAPVVQFLDWPDDQRILVRQLGYGGEKELEWKR